MSSAGARVVLLGEEDVVGLVLGVWLACAVVRWATGVVVACEAPVVGLTGGDDMGGNVPRPGVITYIEHVDHDVVMRGVRGGEVRWA